MTTMHWKDFHHFHAPDLHHAAERFDHLLHDYRFWIALAVAVYLVLMAAAVMLGGRESGGELPETLPFMYGY